MKIKPPFIALFYLLIFIALDYFLATKKIIFYPYNLLGILIMIGGITLIVLSTNLFKKNKTPKNPFKKPKALVTSGPFGISRNPMYLGVTTTSLGIAMLFGTILIFLAPLSFFLTINAVFISREEKLLENLFGKDYLGYKKRVRRWL